MTLVEKLAVIGWAMYYQEYTKEKLDNMEGFEVLMMRDDFERWIKENGDIR